MPDPPGFVRGQHYTAYVSEVDRLSRSVRGVAAERLLLELIGATEAEAQSGKVGVAPWYYEQLANLYARRGDRAAEQAILTRFCHQHTAPGVLRRQLVARRRALEAQTPVGPPPASSPRAGAGPHCTLPGCTATLMRTQARYCSRDHALAALRARPRHGDRPRVAREKPQAPRREASD